jgi:hypothetical protein
VPKNYTTFRLKDVKNSRMLLSEQLQKMWTKAEEHVVKIEKEYCT